MLAFRRTYRRVGSAPCAGSNPGRISCSSSIATAHLSGRRTGMTLNALYRFGVRGRDGPCQCGLVGADVAVPVSLRDHLAGDLLGVEAASTVMVGTPWPCIAFARMPHGRSFGRWTSSVQMRAVKAHATGWCVIGAAIRIGSVATSGTTSSLVVAPSSNSSRSRPSSFVSLVTQISRRAI